MANSRCSSCSYQLQLKVCISFIIIFTVFALVLFIPGGIIYHKEHYAMAVHEPNSCEVMASSYYESECTGYRGSIYVCFRPIWSVTYRIYPDVNEINASIEDSGFRTTAEAQNMLDKYQIGMSYSCWYNVIEPSKARWDEPSTFAGMLLLVFGGVATIVCFILVHFG